MRHDHHSRLRQDRTQARHDAAVTQAEIRRLSRALAPFGVLSRKALEEQAGVQRWRQGTIEAAIQAGKKRGVIEELPGRFYRRAR